MDNALIKKYIAAHLATKTGRIEDVKEPKAGIRFTDGSNESFFYLAENQPNIILEDYNNKTFQHTYNAENRSFTTIEL